VVGIEGVATPVANGQYNAHKKRLSNACFFLDNGDEDIEQQPWAAQGFYKVMLELARAGAVSMMSHIVKLAPEREVYVFCILTVRACDSTGC
jgi:23S rRNA (uracil1939-C5)-methyltransferase